MDAKSVQIKNESETEIFSAPGEAQKWVSGTTINVFDVR